MIGTIYALVTALSWAVSSIILKSLSIKIDSLSLNTLRLCVVSIFLLALIPLSGRGSEFINTPWLPVVYVIISGVVALSLGDTLYIKSMKYADVSRVFPISICSYPVYTMFLAALLLGEYFTWFNVLGTFLVLLGIYLMIMGGRASTAYTTSGRISGKGVILALVAGLTWALAAVTLKLGVAGMDPLVAAAIRIPAAALTLLPIALSQRKRGTIQLRKYGLRSLVLAATSGLLGYGVGTTLLIMAMQLIGAGKTVLLTSASPLFILPFSILILKEKPTRPALIGVFMSVAGICLVAI